uniref:AB hydrolase-1 domain-containing protein n=1 Tax=Eubacterium cellulosolvens (strain ATCC 43171 / JCM 9499 / 6) TaxID=633697 RepID=I5AXC8_EUBC6
MTIHEFGEENEPVVVLVHPSIVMWDYFEYVIPLLETRYHLIIPSLPGYDPDVRNDFTSVEEISTEIENWLIGNNLRNVACLYGCSMGGSIVTRMLADNRVTIQSAVIDGGITPYQLPWIITRFIAVKDFLLINIGKLGGAKLLEKAFSTDELSAEDVQYAAKVLKMISARTIWRTFESCNNYTMPKNPHTDCKHIEYWVAEKEVGDRRGDITYIKKSFPQTILKKIKDVGHGGLAPFHPERFVRGINRVCKKGELSV